jgi:hypothetical protein
MEKVVVVVVVTILEGSFGSGMRFDWENLREPRLVRASSVVKVCSTFVKRTRWGVKGKLTINVEKRSLRSCKGRRVSGERSINKSETEAYSCEWAVIIGLTQQTGRGLMHLLPVAFFFVERDSPGRSGGRQKGV